MLEVLAHVLRQENKIKDIYIDKEERNKTVFSANDIIIYAENPKELTTTTIKILPGTNE